MTRQKSFHCRKTLYWFFLYGFIGWGVEVVYAAIKSGRLVNRGFLCGPSAPFTAAAWWC